MITDKMKKNLRITTKSRITKNKKNKLNKRQKIHHQRRQALASTHSSKTYYFREYKEVYKGR